jgi:GNAT superfamily N-acetyltransferase
VDAEITTIGYRTTGDILDTTWVPLHKVDEVPQAIPMLTHWQERSHRRFTRHFQEMLDLAAHRHYAVNRWLTFERLSVYLRIGRHILDPREVHRLPIDGLTVSSKQTVDIANVGTEEQYQGKGMFTRLVGKIHEMTDLPIYLENAQPEFASHLRQHHGWQLIKDNLGFSYDLVHYRP